MTRLQTVLVSIRTDSIVTGNLSCLKHSQSRITGTVQDYISTLLILSQSNSLPLAGSPKSPAKADRTSISGSTAATPCLKPFSQFWPTANIHTADKAYFFLGVNSVNVGLGGHKSCQHTGHIGTLLLTVFHRNYVFDVSDFTVKENKCRSGNCGASLAT